MVERRALLVCYYFPPLGGAGVGRPLALFKGLAEHGYNCDVLTVKPVAYRVYEPELLEGLEVQRVYRARSFDPQRLLYLLGVRKVRAATIRRGRKVADRFFPDSKVGWVKPAVKLGRTLAGNRGYDVIVSTSPPVSAHLVARRLSADFRLPWVADFRDYWTASTPEEWYSDSRQAVRAHALLDAIKKDASVRTTVNETVAAFLDGAEVIRNSYDESLAGLWTRPPSAEVFTIGLFGTFNDDYPVEPLLRLLDRLRNRAKELHERVRLLQVGDVEPAWLKSCLARFGLEDRCEIHHFVPRAEAVKILSRSHLFYLGMPSEKHAGISTGRIYLLLASGRPILAATNPDSEVAGLIEVSQNGFCFEEGNKEAAVSYLARLIEAFLSDSLSSTPLPEYARQFSSENMVAGFAAIFDRVVSGRRS
ncbi:MAG: glycosyltransferase [candidate division Zixibacteria bacterium]|nr:glycosyltransferase [candidate division Zixibacteria bacterium]